jgi:hypothetical protein
VRAGSGVTPIRTDGTSLDALRFDRMAIKATCIDESQTVRLLIGLNRENVEALLRGETLTLPPGMVPFDVDGEIAIVFAETDEELVQNRLNAPELAPSRVQ